MPNYQYKCSNENCDNEIDINCKMSEYTPTINCSKCNNIMTRKVENMVCGASIDKTGGFYRSVN